MFGILACLLCAKEMNLQDQSLCSIQFFNFTPVTSATSQQVCAMEVAPEESTIHALMSTRTVMERAAKILNTSIVGT
jgi:hypothetical protein